MDPHSLQPPERYQREREWDQRWWMMGAAMAAAAALGQKKCETDCNTRFQEQNQICTICEF